jgi:methionyl-tRNA formyltransferase
MRVVFVGRQSYANNCFANWLARHHDVIGFFRADGRRYTIRHRASWVRRRVQRGGVLRAIDQILYQLYFNAFQKRTNAMLMHAAFAAAFGRDAFTLNRNIPLYEFDDLNSEAALRTLRELQPDLAFAVCVTQYLREPWQQIPRLGSVLYHEGLTPEYKGVHTPFWANARGESHRIGYTLLRLSSEIDGGKPVAQGISRIDPSKTQWWGWAGHQALIDGLPDVRRALAAIEAGEPIAVERERGPEGMWSYAGLSDEMRRLWRGWRERAGNGAPAPHA